MFRPCLFVIHLFHFGLLHSASRRFPMINQCTSCCLVTVASRSKIPAYSMPNTRTLGAYKQKNGFIVGSPCFHGFNLRNHCLGCSSCTRNSARLGQAEGFTMDILNDGYSEKCAAEKFWRALRDDFRTLVFSRPEETISELCKLPNGS